MRASAIVIVILILRSTQGIAQLLVGPTAGINYNWMSFSKTADQKDMYSIAPVIGYHAGAHVSFRVQKRFFLHTSLIYSTKGMVMKAKLNEYDTEDDVDKISMRLNYLEMPIVYTVYFKGSISGKSFKYSIGVGPNISYWLGGKGVLENQDVLEFGYGPMDYKVDFNTDPFPGEDGKMIVQRANRLQLGLNVATSFMFEPAPQRELVVTIRYELGHSYQSRESKGLFRPTSYYEQPLNLRNQGIRISLAYMIDLQIEKRKKGKSTNDPKKRRY